MVTFTVDLPMPPSANMLFPTDRKTGRRFLSKEYAAWKKTARDILLDAYAAAGSPTIGKPYAVHIDLNLNHQSDIANREKPLTDLLVATLPGFPGDQWVNRVVIERNRNIEAARIEVMTLPGNAA